MFLFCVHWSFLHALVVRFVSFSILRTFFSLIQGGGAGIVVKTGKLPGFSSQRAFSEPGNDLEKPGNFPVKTGKQKHCLEGVF